VSNLRQIASRLNIGTDALVFVDDNPFERGLVRKELPEVFVPEMPEDPALYVQCLSRAGYFEGLVLTAEDRQRADQYYANAGRESLRQESPDLGTYLQEMQMEILWKPFDKAGLQRIVQLINKTNQFNLTTRRYREGEVRKFLGDSKVCTWQISLRDRFGDNGVISILIGLLNQEGDMVMDTWLMSCRVLGRQVEEAALNVIVDTALGIGVKRIFGEYKPTSKNGIVADLYSRLGFNHLDTDGEGNSSWVLDVKTYERRETHIAIREGAHAGA
jgi:FkbH-like protein